MRFLFSLLLLLAVSYSFAQDKPFTINDLPVKWTEVSKWDNDEWVVFEPCDAANGSVEMLMVKGKRKLVVGMGHEALTFAVTSVRSINGTTFQFIGGYELVEPKKTDTLQVKYDRYSRIGEWSIPYGESKAVSTCAPTEDIDNYKTVKQPCKECWDDCPGEENETGTDGSDRAQRDVGGIANVSFEGVFNTNPKKEGYWQRLIVKKIANNSYNVEISFGGSVKGCTFKGQGELKNGRIEVPLSKVNKEMKGIMTIDMVNDHLEVYTTNEDDRFELMWFCGGGASLAGDYYREK